jgi:hypothetical protein
VLPTVIHTAIPVDPAPAWQAHTGDLLHRYHVTALVLERLCAVDDVAPQCRVEAQSLHRLVQHRLHHLSHQTQPGPDPAATWSSITNPHPEEWLG